MSRFRWCAFLSLIVLSLSACSSEQEATDQAAKTEEEDSKPFIVDEEPQTPAPEGTAKAAQPTVRESLVGKWILAFSGQSQQENFVDFCVGLLAVEDNPDAASKDSQPYTVTLTGKSKLFPEAKITVAEADAKSLHLVIETQQGAIDFQGVLDAGVVRGSVLIPGQVCNVARLEATDTSTLSDKPPYLPSPGRDAFLTALKTDNRSEAVRQFIAANPGSPLVHSAYLELIASVDEDQPDDAIRQLADAYLAEAQRWGGRIEIVSQAYIALTLSGMGNRPDLAMQYLEAAETQLPALSLSGLEAAIERAKSRVKIDQACGLLAADDPQQREKASQLLHTFRDEDPLNYRVTLALANFAQKQDRTDEAISLYAELAALPMVEQMMTRDGTIKPSDSDLPSEILARLWKTKHGQTEGLQAFLDKVYDESLLGFLDKAPDAGLPASGNRTVLCELLTGAQCPPCVGADVATAGLEAVYPPSRVVVLRYHQHVPGPDPMANEDTEARMFYYSAQGTPTVLLNGQRLAIGGGFMPHVKQLFEQMRNGVDAILQQTTDATLTASAEVKDGRLHFGAQVGGLETADKKLQLRFALAEDEVGFVARNGIRRHEMVVRRMLNGRDGIAIEEGRSTYSASTSLAEIKQDLVDYLDKFEKGSGIMFSVKPLELARLHVVAFVQDDASKEVVQMASVPVTGKIVFPPVSKPGDGSKKADTPPQSTPQQPAKSAQPPKQEASPKTDKKKDTPSAEADGPKLTPPATNAKTPPPAKDKAKK